MAENSAPKIAVIGICGKSYFMEIDHFHKKGETVISKSLDGEIGGKGLNQAVAAVRMGAEVSFLCAVGDDEPATESAALLEREKIKTLFVTKKGKKTPVAFILTDKNGENQVTEYKSAELCADDVKAFEGEIASCDILLLQHEVSQEVNLAAARLAKKHGKAVILNPAPASEISDEMYSLVSLVTPNEQEAKELSLSRFSHSIITLGKKGCLIDGKTEIPALKVTPVDSTGAGDTFNGVLAVCLAEGMPLDKAAKYATTASGISVTRKRVETAIPYRDEIERLMLD